MLLLLIIAAILIVAICIIFPILRTIVGIVILVGIVFLVIYFFVKLFRGHTIETSVLTVLKIAIVVAFALAFIRTLVFAIAWYGGV